MHLQICSETERPCALTVLARHSQSRHADSTTNAAISSMSPLESQEAARARVQERPISCDAVRGACGRPRGWQAVSCAIAGPVARERRYRRHQPVGSRPDRPRIAAGHVAVGCRPGSQSTACAPSHASCQRSLALIECCSFPRLWTPAFPRYHAASYSCSLFIMSADVQRPRHGESEPRCSGCCKACMHTCRAGRRRSSAAA